MSVTLTGRARVSSTGKHPTLILSLWLCEETHSGILTNNVSGEIPLGKGAWRFPEGSGQMQGPSTCSPAQKPGESMLRSAHTPERDTHHCSTLQRDDQGLRFPGLINIRGNCSEAQCVLPPWSLPTDFTGVHEAGLPLHASGSLEMALLCFPSATPWSCDHSANPSDCSQC